jgi:hypothetical protein
MTELVNWKEVTVKNNFGRLDEFLVNFETKFEVVVRDILDVKKNKVEKEEFIDKVEIKSLQKLKTFDLTFDVI